MKQPLPTPAFVFSILAAREHATVVREAIGSERAGILYSLKACDQPVFVSALIDVFAGFRRAFFRGVGLGDYISND